MLEYKLPIRVYIEDTDAGGIVYYVNYLKYFERARTELIRSMGVDKTAVMEDGSVFVVTSASIDYLLPARLDDEIVARATVVGAGGASRRCLRLLPGAALFEIRPRHLSVRRAAGGCRRVASAPSEFLIQRVHRRNFGLPAGDIVAKRLVDPGVERRRLI